MFSSLSSSSTGSGLENNIPGSYLHPSCLTDSFPLLSLLLLKLCCNPSGGRFQQYLIEHGTFFIITYIKKKGSIYLDGRKWQSHDCIQVCISRTKIVQTQFTPAAINPSITIPNPALYSVATVSVISNCIQSWWISISSIIRINDCCSHCASDPGKTNLPLFKQRDIRSRCSFINMQIRLNCISVICSII